MINYSRFARSNMNDVNGTGADAPVVVDGEGRVGRLIEFRRAENGKAGLAVLRDDLMNQEWTADPATVRPASPR